MDADSFKWTVSSAAQPCILQLSFPSKVPCFLWTTGEQVFLKEVVFSRQDSTLPYLTVLDCSSRRKGYLQFIPSTYASTEQYYGVSHGPIIQEQSLYSESNRLRYEMIRMYQDRKYNGTEDLANLMTCANFLVETPSGDRYVPLQSVVSAVSEYCGQSRTFASAIAATFCQHLLAVPGVLSVSAPRRIGTHLSPLQSLSELTVRGVQLSNIKHKFSDPEPRSTTTSPFIRASDLARFGASGKRDASGIANTQNDDDEDDDVSFASVTARIDDSLLAEDTIFGADVEDTDADFDDFFNAYTAPFSPTALDSITARNVRPRKECSTPPCRADLANKLRKSYNTTEDVLVDTWPAPPVPLVNSGHQSNPVDISGIAPGKRRHKHTPAKRMVSPDPDTANYDDFDKLFQDSQNFGYKVVSKTTKVNGSSGKNNGGSSSGHKKSK